MNRIIHAIQALKEANGSAPMIVYASSAAILGPPGI